MVTLYLIEAQAKYSYSCSACGSSIPRGTIYFRHDPFPAARVYRGVKTSHWCRDCVVASNPGPKDSFTGRIRVPVIQVLSKSRGETEIADGLFAPVQVQLVP